MKTIGFILACLILTTACRKAPQAEERHDIDDIVYVRFDATRGEYVDGFRVKIGPPPAAGSTLRPQAAGNFVTYTVAPGLGKELATMSEKVLAGLSLGGSRSARSETGDVSWRQVWIHSRSGWDCLEISERGRFVEFLEKDETTRFLTACVRLRCIGELLGFPARGPVELNSMPDGFVAKVPSK